MNALSHWSRITPVGNLPVPSRLDLRQQIVDELASMLLQGEEILALLEPAEANTFRWVERHVQQAYDEINEVLLQLVDWHDGKKWDFLSGLSGTYCSFSQPLWTESMTHLNVKGDREEWNALWRLAAGLTPSRTPNGSSVWLSSPQDAEWWTGLPLYTLPPPAAARVPLTTMTVRNKPPRTLLEAAFIRYGLQVVTVARLAGVNRMRINRLQRGIAPAPKPLRNRLVKVIRYLAEDESIKEADLFPVEG
jgi:hypothetical protein